MASRITPDDQSSLVIIVTWFLFCTTAIAVIARTATKWLVTRKVTSDDIAIILSFTLGIGNSIAISIATSNGLGKHAEVLSSTQIDNFQKAIYAASLLYILTQCLTKAAVVLLLRSLTPVVLHQRLVSAFSISTGLWTLPTFLAAVFQCKLPFTWKYIGHQCFNRTIYWELYVIFNIITDALIVVLPIIVLWKVRIGRKRKLGIAGCFASRILVIVASILQFIYMDVASETHAQDPTFAIVPTILCTQVVINLSIITASIPYLKPLYLSFETGMLRNGIGGYGEGTDNSKQTPLPHSSRVSKKSWVTRLLPSGNDTESQELHAFSGTGAGVLTKTVVEAVPGSGSAWDSESHTSRTMMIRQTTSWNVDSLINRERGQ